MYTWFAEDPEIVEVEGSVTLRSLKVGKTSLFVQDHRNPKNQASIEVEVTTVN